MLSVFISFVLRLNENVLRYTQKKERQSALLITNLPCFNPLIDVNLSANSVSLYASPIIVTVCKQHERFK